MRERRFDPTSVRSILVIRLYFIGDVLLSTPVLDALKRAFPDASLAVLVKSRAVDVLRNNPNVDEVIEYDAVPGYHNPVWLGRLARRLRRARFDLAVDLTGDLRSSWLLLAADPGFRVGFNHAGFGFLLDRSIPYRASGHGVDHLLSAVAPVGAETDDASPRLYLTDGEMREAERLLEGHGLGRDHPFVGLAPGANRPYRRWGAERFGALACALRDRLGLVSVVTGSRSDAGLAEHVVSHSDGAAVSLAGETDIRGLAGVAARSAVFVANDSGPMHVAASQGTPVVGLFGSSTPEIYAPRGGPSRVVWHRYPCSPCDQKTCVREDGPCMKAIEVSEVLDAVESLLSEGNR
ncbi:MAG: lipopolysaccharide heptosyltransferase II [Candidatus Eisenbacteria bacterium]